MAKHKKRIAKKLREKALKQQAKGGVTVTETNMAGSQTVSSLDTKQSKASTSVKSTTSKKRPTTWAEKNEILKRLDPNSNLYVAALQKYFKQTAASGVNSKSRKQPWNMAARDQEMRVNQVNAYYDRSNKNYFYGVQVNIRRDVNPTASYAGAPVSTHMTKRGTVSHTQFITQQAMDRILSVNGKPSYTYQELSHAVSTKTPLATANDGLVFKGNIASKDKRATYSYKNTSGKTKSSRNYFFNSNTAKISPSMYFYDNRYEMHLEQEARVRNAQMRRDHAKHKIVRNRHEDDINRGLD